MQNTNLIQEIKIGSIRYSIRKVENLRDGNDHLFGKVTHSNSTIELDASLDDQQIKQTLWHEIFHVLRVQAGLPYFKLEEQIAEAFSYGLVGVLQDNPWILQEIELADTVKNK